MVDAQLEILDLPVSKDRVKIRPYMTIGQSRRLQKFLLSKGSFDMESGKLTNITPDAVLEMQDMAAEFLITGVIREGTPEVPFSREWLDNLPFEDGQLVYATVQKFIDQSSLSEDGKKKS